MTISAGRRVGQRAGMSPEDLIDGRDAEPKVRGVFRQTIEAVETLEVLTPQQRDLIELARTGRLRAELEAARPDRDFTEVPEVKLGDVEVAVYRVVTDPDGERETRRIVAPHDPRLQPGTDVAAKRDSRVAWSESAGLEDCADGAEILLSSRLVPFDWDAYWAAPRG